MQRIGFFMHVLARMSSPHRQIQPDGAALVPGGLVAASGGRGNAGGERADVLSKMGPPRNAPRMVTCGPPSFNHEMVHVPHHENGARRPAHYNASTRTPPGAVRNELRAVPSCFRVGRDVFLTDFGSLFSAVRFRASYSITLREACALCTHAHTKLTLGQS